MFYTHDHLENEKKIRTQIDEEVLESTHKKVSG